MCFPSRFSPFGAVALAVLLGIGAFPGLASAQRPGPAGEPVTRIVPSTDAWAGKTVEDLSHVEGMLAARLNNAPKVGEMAPDLVLADSLTGKLHSLLGMCRVKPVILFFGSYSCGATQGSSASLNALARRFGELADFYMVFIREAHPQGSYGDTELAQRFVIPDPKSFGDRIAVAAAFRKQSKLSMPILVDSMDDAAAVRWGAWPVRLFVVDRGGRVVFAGQQGPWFHKPTRAYDPAIPAVPEMFRNLPGYSRESLEEFLEKRFP